MLGGYLNQKCHCLLSTWFDFADLKIKTNKYQENLVEFTLLLTYLMNMVLKTMMYLFIGQYPTSSRSLKYYMGVFCPLLINFVPHFVKIPSFVLPYFLSKIA
ncbi:hypothetical protein MXB_612 [Myxobolus squamalis]|nr:hypothetical protein MXB_612 [Myxobolus squamalis]